MIVVKTESDPPFLLQTRNSKVIFFKRREKCLMPKMVKLKEVAGKTGDKSRKGVS